MGNCGGSELDSGVGALVREVLGPVTEAFPPAREVSALLESARLKLSILAVVSKPSFAAPRRALIGWTLNPSAEGESIVRCSRTPSSMNGCYLPCMAWSITGMVIFSPLLGKKA